MTIIITTNGEKCPVKYGDIAIFNGEELMVSSIESSDIPFGTVSGCPPPNTKYYRVVYSPFKFVFSEDED